ncbi:hypothetical protein HYT53_05985 [Candidatus Woesearchaeota archaeon]|nr:hypothetical protein [Candidatus Woesearchaeota archaeon]
MTKRGAVSSIITLAILLILLAVLFAAFYESLLPSVANAAERFADKTLSRFKREKFQNVEIVADKSVDETYENILSVLRTTNKGPCITTRKAFPRDFKDFKITLSQTEQGIFVILKNKQERVIKSNTISGKIPCVVGEGEAAKNFYNNFLKVSRCTSNCLGDYSAANIEFNSADSIIVNGQKRNLDDGNLVYVTENGNVCFFPTHNSGVSIIRPWEIYTKYGCDAETGSLDDDCIEQVKRKIPQCKNEEWEKILEDYNKNKCKVDKYTCKVESLGCQCFSAGLLQSQQKPEICDETKPFCYDGEYGCNDKGPDLKGYSEVCKKTNKNFELAQKCQVDENCLVKNAPCSCHDADTKLRGKLPYVCLEGNYCYNEQIGCKKDIDPSQPLYVDYCQKSNKN